MEWVFIAIPAVMWGTLRLTLPNQRWEFDFDVTHATFFLLLDRYIRIAAGVIVAGVMVGGYAKWYGDLKGFGAGIAAALYAFMFILQVTSKYEAYLHQKYRQDGSVEESPYTTSQYAMTRTLAYSAAIFLLLGVARVVML